MIELGPIVFIGATSLSPLAPQLKTAEAVLEKYKQALGGVDAIKNVQSETVRGTIENSGGQPASAFVYAVLLLRWRHREFVVAEITRSP